MTTPSMSRFRMWICYNQLYCIQAVSEVSPQRSYNMSRIRSRNTTPEKIVRAELWRRGYRYRLNDKRLPGKPDLVLPKYRAVIFINGCFWHGHRVCPKFVEPKTNAAF